VSSADLLARLASLDASDRAWLLGELPPALRRELVALLDPEEAPDVRSASGTSATSEWETLDPASVAAVLAGEPAWLVSAAIRATEPRWRDRVLESTTPRRRHEIEIADRTGLPLSARAMRFLLDACRSRIDSGAIPTTDGEARSRFAELVDRMRSRFS
jgi:hypothetical protein